MTFILKIIISHNSYHTNETFNGGEAWPVFLNSSVSSTIKVINKKQFATFKNFKQNLNHKSHRQKFVSGKISKYCILVHNFQNLALTTSKNAAFKQ